MSQEPSIVAVIKDALHDAQDLVRSEIALAKAEAREEVGRLARGAALVAGAAIAGIIGVIFLMTTIAWALSETLEWPVWAGFGAITLAMLLAAAVLGYVGRSRLAAGRHMPRTVDTVKENLEWMRARTS
jgi:hypothetical protein